MHRGLKFGAAVLAALFLAVVTAQAQQPYSLDGKTVRILVSNTAGGIVDTEARLVQAYLGRFLPGNPNVIVQNLPGAAGERMLEFISQNDPLANPMIAMISSALIFRARAGDLDTGFDPRSVNWLGSIPASVLAFVVSTQTGITTPDMLVNRPTTAAAVSVGGVSYIGYLLLNRSLGYAIEPIAGYDGIGTMTLALDRNEVDAFFTPYSSFNQFVRPLIDDGDARLLFYLSLENHPELGVPNALDLPMGPAEAQIMRTGLAGTSFGRPYMAPAGSDPAFVAAMREAFDRMAADPAFIADAAALGIDIRYRDAAGIEAAVANLYATPDSVIAQVGAILFAD